MTIAKMMLECGRCGRKHTLSLAIGIDWESTADCAGWELGSIAICPRCTLNMRRDRLLETIMEVEALLCNLDKQEAADASTTS